MRRICIVLTLIAAPFVLLACGNGDPSLKDGVLVLPYLPKVADGSVSFDAHPHKNGTAVIGENDLAFWVSEGKVYTVSPQAQAAQPTLPKAPEGIQYDAAFMDDTPPHEDSAADKALEDARRLREQGDYEAALQKHIWYHEHALDIDEAQGGVRLSFALSNWMELAAKYPKALEALKGIRDRDTARLMNGETDWQLFHDVAAINRQLGEPGATVNLFKHLDASNDTSFASRAFIVADHYLVEAGEFALARKYLGDPIAKSSKAEREYEEDVDECGDDEVCRKAFGVIYTEEITDIVKILKGTGDIDIARKIQAEGLKVFDTPELRAAIDS